MAERIAVIQGHPDVRGERFGHALADAYAAGAAQAQCRVETIEIARLDFPMLRTREDWESTRIPDDIRKAQEKIVRAEHLVIFYPLWLGSMPALLKGLARRARWLEQLQALGSRGA